MRVCARVCVCVCVCVRVFVQTGVQVLSRWMSEMGELPHGHWQFSLPSGRIRTNNIDFSILARLLMHVSAFVCTMHSFGSVQRAAVPPLLAAQAPEPNEEEQR